MQEAALAASMYSGVQKTDVDPDNGSWVMFYDFALPAGYNHASTHILLQLPPDYPQTPPDWFYLDMGVRRRDGKHPHIIDTGVGHRPTQEGWSTGSLHIHTVTWRPTSDPLTGHSLVSVCELIDKAFKRWLHQ